MSTSNSSPRHTAVGLRDIAEQLNVSVSLVSKVLSGRLGTSGANVAKIRAIKDKARELGYQKNLLAEALRTGRQNVLALFLHRHGEPGSGIVDEMILGIAEEAARADQRLAIHYYESPQEFRSFIPRIHPNAIDGILLGGVPHFEIIDDLKAMYARRVPIVSIHDTQLDPQLPNIGIDQRQVTRIATNHLIDQGCTRIAHIRVMASSTSLAPNRFEGYKIALKERDIDFRSEFVIEAKDFTYEVGVDAVQRLLASGIKFDGVVAACDTHGLATINTLARAGINVPEDVKVTGVDNAPFCRYGLVELTSVSQEFQVRGGLAARTLLDSLSGTEMSSTSVPPAIFVRRSTQR